MTSPVGSSVPGNTPISDEAVEAYAAGVDAYLRGIPAGEPSLRAELIRGGLSYAAPLLVSAEAERLRAERDDALADRDSAERWAAHWRSRLAAYEPAASRAVTEESAIRSDPRILDTYKGLR